MNYQAISKNVRVSPRKLRTVVKAVKNLSLVKALENLEFLAKAAALPIRKALLSAVANSKLLPQDLTIKNIFVDEGIKMKRRDTSHRASRDSGLIQKRASHITVILTDN